MARDTMLSSPSYADPLNVLNEANLLVEIEDEISIPQRIEPNDKEYCLRTYRKIFTKLIPMFVFILFLIFELILACFNCKYDGNTFSTIRFVLFLSVPFLFGIFIYIMMMLQTRAFPDALQYSGFILRTLCTILFYTFLFGCIPMGSDMNKMNNIINNSSIIDDLPCSITYYEVVYILAIINLCIPGIVIFLSVILNQYGLISRMKQNFKVVLSISFIFDELACLVMIFFHM